MLELLSLPRDQDNRGSQAEDFVILGIKSSEEAICAFGINKLEMIWRHSPAQKCN